MRSMLIQRSALWGACVLGLMLTDQSQVLAQQAQAAPTKSSVAKSPDSEKAIRETASRFVDAFNKADAKGVAALWTEDGEYVDDNGDRTSGREAIESKYAAFFVDNRDAKMEVVIDSIHQVSPDTAIEDGHSKLSFTAPDGSTASGSYMAVHVNRNGKWLMASVRDMPAEPASDGDPLEDLRWLIGAWHAEYLGVEMQIEYRWLADKSFVEATNSKQEGEKVTPIATQIIGVDPRTGRITSWTFNADRSYAHGVWIPRETGWAIEFNGVSADGISTSAVNVLSRVEDALIWKSTRRTVAGKTAPDTEEVVLKRK